MPSFFGRKFDLKVVTFGGREISIPNTLKYTFSIEKKIVGFTQPASFTIYNLSADTETDILQNGKYVSLEAGYEDGPYGLVFKGPIFQPVRGKEDNVSYYIKLLCIDGDSSLNVATCSFALAAGYSQQYIAQQVARASNIPFDIKVDSLGNTKTQRGISVFGQPKDTLQNIASNNNAFLYTEGGTIHISSLSKAPPATTPTLNSQSGMVGVPNQTSEGIQVRSLINPTIQLDSWFNIDNKSINEAEFGFGQPTLPLDKDGVYRVIGITVTGDTRGNDWYYDIEAISQAGAVSSLLMDSTQSAN